MLPGGFWLGLDAESNNPNHSHNQNFNAESKKNSAEKFRGYLNFLCAFFFQHQNET